MLPKAPDSELKKDDNPLVEAIFNYQLIHVEAYVVHIDMVSQNEVAFKLTQDTIDALVEYHKDIYSVDAAASTWNWSEKDMQVKKLHDDFVQAINRYVYRTHVRALEGLEDDGAGEMLEGRSQEVKSAIMGLFLPLLPPPPRMVNVVDPYSAPHMLEAPNQWWLSPPVSSCDPAMSAPMEPWRVLGSTPSPTTTSGADSTTSWSSIGFDDSHMPSPSPPFSQPQQPYTTAEHYFSSPQTMAPIMPLPLPSALAQQCGVSAGAFGGFDGFGWGSNSMASPYAIQI